MSVNREMVLWLQPFQKALYFQQKVQLRFEYLVSIHPQTELFQAVGHTGSSGNPNVM